MKFPAQTAQPSQQHAIGVMLVTVSALVFSSAGIFTRAADAGAWTVIFWRGLFAAILTTVLIAWRGQLKKEFADMGISGLAVAIVGASATAAFLTAFKLTAIANVAMIWASAPLFAALLAYLAVGERLSTSKIAAAIVAMGGVAVITGSSIGSFNLTGDLLALWMTLGMAVCMVIYRRWKHTPAAGPAALSSLLLLPVCVLFEDVLAVSSRDLVILACFGLAFAVASVTMMEGVKRIPAGEAALIGTLETPIAPVLAYLFFAEVPVAATLAGGAIILAAVIFSQLRR
ncbi:MAG: DMT family transporter [Phyllobacteriaceae bacterium]|nr:DMT family transporter [Phyllobacteriaceae bacterium]